MTDEPQTNTQDTLMTTIINYHIVQYPHYAWLDCLIYNTHQMRGRIVRTVKKKKMYPLVSSVNRFFFASTCFRTLLCIYAFA